MTCQSAFVYSDELLKYRFNSSHPFDPIRILLTKDLLEASKKLSKNQIIEPRNATDKELALFHDDIYIEAVKKASSGYLQEDDGFEFGLGTEDTPIFSGMHEAAAKIVGGTLSAVEAVLDNDYTHALNLSGGLHHGLKRKATGFCIYNDGAIAMKYIREKYDLKVLYVDTDAHHGDGVQWAFYDDPNVCTFSIHETGRYLFPGTGNVSERGMKEGHGFSFNIPIDAFTENESFLHVYEMAFKKIVHFFQPDIIITQNGADAHCFDPLTHLCTTMKIYEQIPLLAHELAHKYCNGRWIALGGGGYDLWRVVPRAWGQVWNVMNTNTVQTGKIPTHWLDKWSKDSPTDLPLYWYDNDDIVPDIPRKREIEDKNNKILETALQYTKQMPRF